MVEGNVGTTNTPRIFVLTSRTYETAGGRTKATIERMKSLQEHYPTTLIEMSSTKYPGEELPAIFAKYQTEFAVINPWTSPTHNTTRIRKNYLNYVLSRTGGLGEEKLFAGAQENFALPTLSGGKVKTYTEDGKIRRMREYHSDGSVEFFALNDRQNIFLRELYRQDKLVARYYLDIAGKVHSGFTLDKNGTKKFVYRQNNGRLVDSDDIVSHNLIFLTSILRAGDTVISEVRYYDAVLAKLSPEIRKIHVWHEIAISASGQKISTGYDYIVSPDFPIGKDDRIVVFTDDARAEYSRTFPHLQKFLTVIPYGTDSKPPIAGIVRDKNRVVSVGRLASPKDVFAQIKAFALFHKAYHQTYLKVVGEGEDEAELRQLVDTLHLQSAVEFCGFSNSVDAQFQQAGMMIFSSSFESFGLTVLESLSNGTPVASYDVRFGTKTMLKNRKNGIVAKANTPSELAEAMKELYQLKLSPKRVQRTIAMLSKENSEAKWLSLVDGEEDNDA